MPPPPNTDPSATHEDDAPDPRHDQGGLHYLFSDADSELSGQGSWTGLLRRLCRKTTFKAQKNVLLGDRCAVTFGGTYCLQLRELEPVAHIKYQMSDNCMLKAGWKETKITYNCAPRLFGVQAAVRPKFYFRYRHEPSFGFVFKLANLHVPSAALCLALGNSKFDRKIRCSRPMKGKNDIEVGLQGKWRAVRLGRRFDAGFKEIELSFTHGKGLCMSPLPKSERQPKASTEWEMPSFESDEGFPSDSSDSDDSDY